MTGCLERSEEEAARPVLAVTNERCTDRNDVVLEQLWNDGHTHASCRILLFSTLLAARGGLTLLPKIRVKSCDHVGFPLLRSA